MESRGRDAQQHRGVELLCPLETVLGRHQTHEPSMNPISKEFTIHHLIGGDIHNDKATRTTLIKVKVANEEGEELHFLAPYGQLDGLCQGFLAMSNAAFNAAKESGFIPDADHNQPAAFIAEGVSATPNYLRHDVTLRHVGRIAPNAPLGLGSVLLTRELAEATIEHLQRALTAMRDYGHDAGDGARMIGFDGPSINLQKAKLPMTWATVPSEALPFLAQIAVLWGSYERDMHDCVAALLRHRPHPDYGTDPKRLGFSARNDLMRDQSAVVMQGRPELLRHFRKMFEDGANLHAKRNVLLHGRITLVIKIRQDSELGIPKAQFSIEARGMHKGKERRMLFNTEKLEDMYYDIGHLAARMQNVVNISRPGSAAVAPFPSADISFLQGLLPYNSPRQSNLPKRRSRPEPSQG